MRAAERGVTLILGGLVCLMLAAAPAGQYSVNADAGTVVDNMSGLIWQRGHSDSRMSLADAGIYCADLVLGGSSEWRVPALFELSTIVSPDRSGPAIDLVAFPDTPPSEQFWVSTPYVGRPNNVWAIDFKDGHSSNFGSAVTFFVRCVR